MPFLVQVVLYLERQFPLALLSRVLEGSTLAAVSVHTERLAWPTKWKAARRTNCPEIPLSRSAQMPSSSVVSSRRRSRRIIHEELL